MTGVLFAKIIGKNAFSGQWSIKMVPQRSSSIEKFLNFDTWNLFLRCYPTE